MGALRTRSAFTEMEYLIRFTQWHETFRLAETQAIAYLLKINLKIISYSDEVR